MLVSYDLYTLFIYLRLKLIIAPVFIIIPEFRILTWEDGYFDHPKPSKIAGSVSDNIYFSGAKSIPFSSCETIKDCCGSGDYSIGLAVANMSSLQYAFGEG